MTTSRKYHKKTCGFNDMTNSNVSDNRQTKTPPTSHNKNHEHDATMVDNSYTVDNRERLLNHVLNITFERDRYTTSITIEFRQKSDQISITLAKLQRELFAEILILYPTIKMIRNDGKVYIHTKDVPIEIEYDNVFTEVASNNKKFNTVKAYVCCKIATALHCKKFMYNNNGAKNILIFLRQNNMLLKWNEFSTHREALL